MSLVSTPAITEVDPNTPLKIGDLVRIRPGTLAWSGEPMLRKRVGQVIAVYYDDNDKPRVSVEFTSRKLLARREASVFMLVERPPV